MSSESPLTSTGTLPAGFFGEWLSQFRRSLRGDSGTDVPCGDCIGCCVSSYHIPLRPADTEALGQIPVHFLLRVPGQPSGHAMMGFREDGTCHMLNGGKCTVYRQRPQTCRDYDCRIFAAAGIEAGGLEKHVINTRVRQWRFTYESAVAKRDHEAVLAAASFIRQRKSSFPNERAPTAPTGIAVLAIKSYHVFLDVEIDRKSDTEIAYAIIRASGDFDAGSGI